MARHFSQDEARRIFARAAERQHSGPALGEGLTLEELQVIGREAGIDPAHVAAAATEADAVYEAPTWQGVPLRTRRVRQLAAPVSDAAWGRILDLFRDRNQVSGVVEEIGERRSWTVHKASLQGERVRVETTSEGTELMVESGQAPEQGVAYGLGLATVPLALILGLAGLVKDKPGALWFALVLGLIGMVVAVGSSISVRRRARTRPAEIDALADRIERIVAADADEPVAPAAEPTLAPRLTLDDDDASPSRTAPLRTRTRS